MHESAARRPRRRRRDARAVTTTRRRYELNGKLMYPMSVAASPSVAPQILIENASYGWTEELLDEWKARYHKDIFDMQAIRAKRTAGLALTREDNNRLRKLPAIEEKLKKLYALQPGSVDATGLVQRRVEACGGSLLFFAGDKPEEELQSWASVELQKLQVDPTVADDLNEALGDPTPYQTKLLHIEYLIVGHDAERRTEAPEATASGYEANFIMQKKGIVERVLTNTEEGKAFCQEHVLIGIPTIMPTVEVRYASYGHPTKPKFNWNVTEAVRSRRFEVLRCLHFLGWTRVHRTMTWVVSFDFRATAMLRAGEMAGQRPRWF